MPTKNNKMRHALIWAWDREVLRLMEIDEMHLFAMHGCFFCKSICILQRMFFVVLYAACYAYLPLILLMSATMPKRLVSV